MSWNIPPIEALEIQDRKEVPKAPETFDMAPVFGETPKPVPVNMTGMVTFYDFTDRRVIESLDAHAEEVGIFCKICFYESKYTFL